MKPVIIKSLVVFTSLLFVVFASFAQDQISGTVYDKQTGEVLIGATVVDKTTQKGAITNHYGHFFLKVSEPDSLIHLVVSYLGYKPFETSVIKSVGIDLQLEPKEFEIEGIVVKYDNGLDKKPKTGHYKMLSKELRHMPSFSGESDLITLMQLIPGVAITGEGNATMNVRGGSSDQNLFLIDDMPLYYVNHLGGFLSTFNTDIIKSTDFYKSGFSSYYGGRLSSIMDVRTNDGNLHEYDVYGTIGLISSKIGVEGPIIKNRSSFLVSARKNTIPLFRWLWDLDADYRFYDTNLKLNYILSSKDRIFFSFYNGSDKVEISNNVENSKNKQSILWGNIAGSVRYSRVVSSKLYANLILGHTSYLYNELMDSERITNGGDANIFINEFLASISDNFLKSNVEYYPLEKIKILAGYEFIQHTYRPGKATITQSGPDYSDISVVDGFPESKALEHSGYVQADMENLYKFNIHAGMRSTLLFANGRSYFLPEPRISLSREIGRFLLQASYDVMHQNFHVLTNQGAGIPVEYRIPALPFAPPERSEMYSMGISYIPNSKNFQIDIDLYQKRLHNLVTLKEGVNYSTLSRDLEDIIWPDGMGESKGVEFLIRKKTGNTTGWIGTTIAKTERTFEEINDGKPYPFKYDRPFEFKAFLLHQFNKKISFSATWVYGAGAPISIPVGQYYDLEDEVVLIYGERNSVRGEPYHRLDIGFSYKLFPKWGESEWNFSILNLYNRKNPYYYYAAYDNGFAGTGKMTFYQQSLFPFLPSVSYSFKF